MKPEIPQGQAGVDLVIDRMTRQQRTLEGDDANFNKAARAALKNGGREDRFYESLVDSGLSVDGGLSEMTVALQQADRLVGLVTGYPTAEPDPSRTFDAFYFVGRKVYLLENRFDLIQTWFLSPHLRLGKIGFFIRRTPEERVTSSLTSAL